MADLVDSSICPLCQTANKCGVNKAEPCWCTKEKVPAELIAQVSDKYVNKSCICQACIEKYNLTIDLSKANIKEVT
ncbi:cysteine-rich CWC family protein [Colwellia sp. 1_MG-2023]|uniref:cysteine-rich CWC family protein n=1 Tax=Colwellia sp. 1_MG-2023 TaxID=3062649 RepID=UPI0026E1AF18|nr:cysteine-rich CWC family protein [Colwellia sp. 1_MG-2023]MDO6445220.1 cysteine-rich CWC family protein [Colwellia sp. 1_MG-2023]